VKVADVSFSRKQNLQNVVHDCMKELTSYTFLNSKLSITSH